MKNITYLIIMTAIICTACSKDSMPKGLQSEIATHTMDIEPSANNYYKQSPEKSTVTYSIQDGRIIISSSEDFKYFMWGLESKNIPLWENTIEFQSYRKSNDFSNQNYILNNCIELAAALNPNGIIQIEPYIFKFNIKKKKIYAINSNITGAIAELNLTSAPTSQIMEFSFEDDIWYLIENDMLPNQDASESTSDKVLAKKCNEQKAKNFTLRETPQACTGDQYNWHQMTSVLKYNRFGIWETCRATLYNNAYNVYAQSNDQLTDFHIYGGIINYDFDEYCGAPYQGVYNIPSMTDDHFSILLRSDKKPLARNKNSVTMDVVFNYLCAPNDPLLHHSTSKSF